MTRGTASSVLVLSGAALIVAGCWLINLPLALVVLGVIIGGAGMAAGLGDHRDTPP